MLPTYHYQTLKARLGYTQLVATAQACDPETGKVSGPSASWILELAACRSVSINPPPQSWDVSPEPLKSKTDMAAIIGYRHELPQDLREHYPRPWNPETDFDPNVVY